MKWWICSIHLPLQQQESACHRLATAFPQPFLYALSQHGIGLVATLLAGNRFSGDCTSWQKKIQFWTSATAGFRSYPVHDVLQMDCQAVQSLYSSPTGDHMQITMTAGKLFAESILQRLAITMDRQLAQGLAQQMLRPKAGLCWSPLPAVPRCPALSRQQTALQ